MSFIYQYFEIIHLVRSPLVTQVIYVTHQIFMVQNTDYTHSFTIYSYMYIYTGTSISNSPMHANECIWGLHSQWN